MVAPRMQNKNAKNELHKMREFYFKSIGDAKVYILRLSHCHTKTKLPFYLPQKHWRVQVLKLHTIV
jgi:hypothetical protein